MASVEELFDELGGPGTFRLIRAFGGEDGGRIYIPAKRAMRGHAIEREIGREAAQVLSSKYSAQVIKVPCLRVWVKYQQNLRIRKMFIENGLSVRELSRLYGRSVKSIRRVVQS